MTKINKHIIKSFNQNGYFLYKGFFSRKRINEVKKWMLKQKPISHVHRFSFGVRGALLTS